MTPMKLWQKIWGRYQRTISVAAYRRSLEMRNTASLISFTFDDFPLSALETGGAILERHGLAGTYYASLGLMGQDTPVGKIFSAEDLGPLLAKGHELGCHTFHHCHAWETSPRRFEESSLANKQALARLAPGVELESLSYPLLCPRPNTKRRLAKKFLCCRGGGESFNSGMADLNYLKGFFIERSWGNFELIKTAIDRNREARGWLIFATHDVCDSPTSYGCTPAYFEQVVRCSLDSGARILPVTQAFKMIAG